MTSKSRTTITSACDLLEERDLPVSDGAFEIEMPYGEVRVIHAP